MHLWIDTSGILLLIVGILYSYQMGYLVFVLLHDGYRKLRRGKQPEVDVVPHRFAALITARNEANVIGQLLNTINGQDYPEEMRHIIVIADNCTDNTAEVARQHGATVFERFNSQQVGKGYALTYAFQKIAETFGDDYFDAYIIFDK